MIDGRATILSRPMLYTDVVGRDACGIGAVAAREGDRKPSREVVEKALLALCNMEHRGGVCGQSGDGAGLTFGLPQAFFKEEARRLNLDGARFLKPEDRLVVGVLFQLEKDASKHDKVRGLVRDVMRGGPVQLLGFRPVPTNDAVLPPEALASKPVIEQVILRVATSMPLAQLEQWLYRRRLQIRQRLIEANLAAYVPSLSSRLVSYKGLLTSYHLADYFADLHNPAFETGIAIFHRRYSTNTYPNWSLAQPFRFSCHNGEINTLHTNRNAVHAYSRSLDPPPPGRDLLTPLMSDSASLDEWLEHLMLEKG